MPPSKKNKEEKKVEEVKEEIGVFVFPDGSRYDGQFVRKVTVLEEKDDEKGGKGNKQSSSSGGGADQSNRGGKGDDKDATALHTATPAQLLVAECPSVLSSALTPTISTTTNTTATAGAAAGGGTSTVTTSTIIYRHGNGIYQDGNTTYDGTWDHDRMHGFGRLMVVTNKSVEKSNWNSNNTNGNSTSSSSLTFITSSPSASYVGYFRNNEFDGEGTYRWADGSSYQGNWKANKQHGEGIYVDVKGKKWSGKWFDGVGSKLVEVED